MKGIKTLKIAVFCSSSNQIDEKFQRFATPVLGGERTQKLLHHVRNMGSASDLKAFNALIYTTGVQS